MFAKQALAATATAVTLCVAPVVPLAQAAEPFVLTSPAFVDGGQIPLKHGGKREGSATCKNENVSLPFAWKNVPAGTKSLALIMIDPEGRGSAGLVHFFAYGIPADMTGLAEGQLNRISDKFVFGKGATPDSVYFGPCSTSAYPHHYTFLLVANDLEPQALPAGLGRDELLDKLQGHTKGVTGLVGLWGRPAD